MIDAHYSKLRNIPIASTYYEKLRSIFDQIERHIRSLEALGQSVENEFMVSLIRSKLPRTILAKLEEYKNSNDISTVVNLRKELKRYLSTQELGDRLTKLNGSKGDFEKRQGETGDFTKYQRYGSDNNNQSTGSFTVGETHKRMCEYRGKQHWSEECNEYPNLQRRKSKAKGFCFICLRKGHLLRECNSTRACVYCKKKGNHHRSCPSQFSMQQKELLNASLKTKETNLIAIDKRVIMQTATIDLENGKDQENGIKVPESF